MKLKGLMRVLTSTKYNITVFNADCKYRVFTADDVIGYGRFDILEESLSDARKRIDFLEKYSKGTVEFVSATKEGAVDITILF